MNVNDSINFKVTTHSRLQTALQGLLLPSIVSASRNIDLQMPNTMRTLLQNTQQAFGSRTRGQVNQIQSRSAAVLQMTAHKGVSVLSQVLEHPLITQSQSAALSVAASGRTHQQNLRRKIKFGMKNRSANVKAPSISNAFSQLYKRAAHTNPLNFIPSKRLATSAGIGFFGCYSMAILLGMMTKPALSMPISVSKVTDSTLVQSTIAAKERMFSSVSNQFQKLPTFGQLKGDMVSSVKTSLVDFVVTVLHNDYVQREWLGWLERAFSTKQTYDSLLVLLLNGIKDSRFLVHAKDYGLDLISHNVQQTEVKTNSAEMILDVLIHEPKVAQESLELVKWAVQEPVTYQIAKDCMVNVVNRDDTFDIICWQLSCGCTDGINKQEILDLLCNGCTSTMFDARFLNSCYEQLAEKTVLNFATLGLYTYLDEGEVSTSESSTVSK